MPYPGLLNAESLPLQQSTAGPYLHRRHSDTVLAQFLWGLWILVHTRFVWALQASLACMGFDSKCNFVPPTIFLGLLLCLWMWGIFFLVGSNILLSTVAQQIVVILEFSLSSIPILCGLFVAHQTLLSMDFSRQEYWNGLLFPLPGDLPDLGIEFTFLCLLHCRQILHHWATKLLRWLSGEESSCSKAYHIVQNLPANAGGIEDMDSIPGSGRCPGGGNDNPPQYFYWANPMDREAG